MYKYEILIDAIMQNKIETLTLCSKMNANSFKKNYFVVENVDAFTNIINAIATNTSLKTLVINSIRLFGAEAMKGANALIYLAENNRSLSCLEFSSSEFKQHYSANELPQLTKFLQGLHGNMALRRLVLENNLFEESQQNVTTVNFVKKSVSGVTPKEMANNNNPNALTVDVYTSSELLITLIKNRKNFELGLQTTTNNLSLPYILERLSDEKISLARLEIDDIQDGIGDCLPSLTKYILIGQPTSVAFSYYNNALNNIDDSKLFAALKTIHLKSLEFLGETYVSSSALAGFLQNNSCLKTFRLKGFELKEKSFSKIINGLRDLKTLEKLELKGEVFENEDEEAEKDYMKELIDVVIKLPNLRFLSVNVTENDDNILKHFERLGSKASLVEFAMNEISSKVSIDGIKCLRNILANPKLQIFRAHAEDYRLTDKDVAILMEALKYNKGLCVLDLRDNQITDEGAKIICERILAEPSCRLVEINLTGNKLTEFGYQLIAAALNKLKEPNKESPMEIDNSSNNNNNNSSSYTESRMELN